jgi:signal transduction histidine kinase/CheY-like chemotaxis protein
MENLASHSETLRSRASAYLVAVLITALAAAVRLFLFGVLADAEPYMTFVIAVVVAAAYGGLGPGLLATGLGAVAGVYFFVAPYFSLRIEEVSEGLACALFVTAGVTISSICEALHRGRRRLEVKQGELEQEVQERERAETAARQSEARLKEADRHKDEFLALLAHELRNPLAPIRSAIRLLQLRGSAEPDLRWGRDVIERQVECLSRLIDDLLDVSRISRGKMALRKQRVGLAEIIQGAVESSRPLIDQHGHELRVRLPPEPIDLEADLVRLAQVFMNLLNNAAKYIEHGGRIWLTAGRQGGGVVVSVRDTGIGIPADKVPRLFEMFYQVDHALKRSEGGLGIGLTLVRRLVEMHGGTVEARSEGPGKGSEFLVRLPAAGEGPPPDREDMCGHGGMKAPTARRILVVDDDPDSAESLAMLLRLYGSEVQTAHDGLEAVQTAKGFGPDVVLLDIGMPKLNGFDACRRIRQEPWGQHVTLIAISGWGHDEDRQRAKEAGFDHHLVKPVDPVGLAKALTD